MSNHAVGENKQELERGLSFWGNLSLTLSDITPTASLLVVGSSVVAIAGTGSLWSYLIGCAIAMCVALCMGELGSMYPSAGGLYSIVTRVLGKPVGFLALLDYIGQAVFLPASIAIGVGVYINQLVSGVDGTLAAVVVMISVTLLALLRITFNSWLTAVFLALELIVVGIIFIAGIVDFNQPLDILTHPVIPDGGALTGVATGLIVTALATAMFSVNGYDAAINWSEETQGSRHQIGKAVVTAASIGILFELVPFIASMFGSKDLNAYLSSPTPLITVVQDAFGKTVVDIVTVGAIVAILNAALAITLQFSRITWSSGRDEAWPAPISRALSRVNSNGAPWVATLLIGGCATILCARSSLLSVVSMTAVLIITLYALVAIAVLVSRFRDKDAERPYKLPLFPLAPVIALAGVVIALTKQTQRDLLIVAGIFLFGVAYYGLYLRTRPDRYNVVSTDPESDPESEREAVLV
jgi:amino acid transporter